MYKQISLFDSKTLKNGNGYHEVFKRVYYHLYSNSGSSRAESIFDDIAKLLLIKMMIDKGEIEKKLLFNSDKKNSLNTIIIKSLSNRFPELIDSNDNFAIDQEQIFWSLKELDEVSFIETPSSALGDAFQAIIGPSLRGDKGQFFTPNEIVKTMVEIASPEPEYKIVDPAAGTGGFLVESHRYRQEKFPLKKAFGSLIGIEKDKELQRLGGAMVSIATNGIGRIVNSNSLDYSFIKQSVIPSPFDADIVLTNPPFGSKIGINDKRLLSLYSLGHTWFYSDNDKRWYKGDFVRNSQDPQTLFIELCMLLLRPGGLLGIVLPEGLFGNRQSGYIWDYIRESGDIETMIDCPRTSFQPSTDTKTNILFIRKNESNDKKLKKVFIAVAKSCGHDRRGRRYDSLGNPVENDFSQIAKGYLGKDKRWWSHCKISDPYYLVPRFYHEESKDSIKKLSTSWKGEIISFKELVEAKSVFVRKGVEVGAEAYGTGDIPFVRTSDIHNWEISLNPTNGVSDEIYDSVKGKQDLRSDDILLVVDGRYRIGKTAILHDNSCKCVVQSHFRIITVSKISPINPYEFLFILNQQEVLNELRSLVFIQSTLGSIGKRLYDLILPIPSKTDEWMKQISAFRNAIKSRADMLKTLSEFEANDLDF